MDMVITLQWKIIQPLITITTKIRQARIINLKITIMTISIATITQTHGYIN